MNNDAYPFCLSGKKCNFLKLPKHVKLKITFFLLRSWVCLLLESNKKVLDLFAKLVHNNDLKI